MLLFLTALLTLVSQHDTTEIDCIEMSLVYLNVESTITPINSDLIARKLSQF